MKRRTWFGAAAATLAPLALGGCASPAENSRQTTATGLPALMGTGDLGVIIERADGALTFVNTSSCTSIGRVNGLGDLSHASVVFSRDERYAYVFGRDGGLTKVDLLTQAITGRVIQAGNSIGGAINADGTLVAAQNYTPGGVKIFRADSLELLADLPALAKDGKRSRVVGLADLPQNRFIYSLFDTDSICIADCSDISAPRIQTLEGIGRQPYDAMLTPNGRHYIAGLFGEDGLALVDLWDEKPTARRILSGYGRGEKPLPVYKMPHLRGWTVAGQYAYLPAIGRHEVLVVDTHTWREAARIPVAGQPVFVMARPDGRQVWVNFSVPDYDRIQVIDTPSQRVAATLQPGKAVMHMEFAPRGQHVWISCRDSDQVKIYDTHTLREHASISVKAPSGIFFTSRAQRMGL